MTGSYFRHTYRDGACCSVDRTTNLRSVIHSAARTCVADNRIAMGCKLATLRFMIADKLAVVVPVPKSKQRKSGPSQRVQEAHSGLPIGGWHYIICLNDGRPNHVKPCSIQGNAIRPEPGNQQVRHSIVEHLPSKLHPREVFLLKISSVTHVHGAYCPSSTCWWLSCF